MRAFAVKLNNKPLCVAGVGTNGVLTVIASHVVSPERASALELDVGGLFSETGDHAKWVHVDLKVGDRVVLTVLETESVDKPGEQHRFDPKAHDKSQKAYVHAWAKRFGWTITKKKKSK